MSTEESEVLVRSEKERAMSPLASQTDLAALIGANSAFGFDLYQMLKDGDNNLFFSPYSISLALAMVCAGARGETLKEMTDTLHLAPLLDELWPGCVTNTGTLRSVTSQERVHRAFSRIDLDLNQGGVPRKDRRKDGFRFRIVNAIWGQKGYGLLPEFLDVLAEYYGSGVRILDFARDPERSRLMINKWVSGQTEERIKDLLPQGAIHGLTRLVLTSAIYFLAPWKHPFPKRATSGDIFHLLDGSKIMVPMMRQEAEFKYARGDYYQAVELPYSNSEFSMVILFPDTGKFETFQRSLHTDLAKNVFVKLKSEEVILSMPKFDFASGFNLRSTVTAMGMRLAFSDMGDFSGMTNSNDLFIDNILHRAFVSVDEAGTQAVTATGGLTDVTAAEGRPREVTVDHAFIFLIRDAKTESIFFIGHVTNPLLQGLT